MAQISRRRFLHYSCLAAISMTLCPCSQLLLKSVQAAELSSGGTDYYLTRRTELIAEFKGVLGGVAQFLQPELGQKKTGQITAQALAEFERLLPGLPELGGERNIDTQFIFPAVWMVALYKPLRSQGKTAAELGKIIYQLSAMELKQTNKEQALAEGKKNFSPEGMAATKEWADWTQKREYSANWVAEFIPGDGKSFDYGTDYTECALVKYFQAQGVAELAPYICTTDFIRSQTYGTGLQRSKTIARGDGICNFRYQEARPVTQDWDSEVKLISNS